MLLLGKVWWRAAVAVSSSRPVKAVRESVGGPPKFGPPEHGSERRAGTDKRADSNLAVPVSPSFLGLRLPVQAYGIGRGGAVTLGNALELVVGS